VKNEKKPAVLEKTEEQLIEEKKQKRIDAMIERGASIAKQQQDEVLNKMVDSS